MENSEPITDETFEKEVRIIENIVRFYIAPDGPTWSGSQKIKIVHAWKRIKEKLIKNESLSMKKLKSCPFCSTQDPVADNTIEKGLKIGFVQCRNESCGATMKGRTLAHAIKMWEKRPTDLFNLLPPVDVEAERLIDEHLSKKPIKMRKLFINNPQNKRASYQITVVRKKCQKPGYMNHSGPVIEAIQQLDRSAFVYAKDDINFMLDTILTEESINGVQGVLRVERRY